MQKLFFQGLIYAKVFQKETSIVSEPHQFLIKEGIVLRIMV